MLINDAAIVMMGANSGVGSTSNLPPIDPFVYFFLLIIFIILYVMFMKLMDRV